MPYSFNIVVEKGNSLKLLFRIGDKWIDADNCGLGLKDVLVMITFISATNYNFYLIEEPENHLHADFQKRLLNYLNSVKNKQFLISTHSSTFLDINHVNKVFYCWFDDEIKLSDETTLSEIINSLGYSITENLTSDAIILTEGPKDIPVIKKILKWIGAAEKYNIKLWPLGGDIMGELDLTLFHENQNVFAIIDSDPGSKAMRNKFMAKCKEHGIKCYKLERYATENYFSLSALRTVFPDQIPANLVKLDHNVCVDEQIGFKPKKSIKGRNHDIVNVMKLEDFYDTDLFKYISDIQTRLQKKFVRK